MDQMLIATVSAWERPKPHSTLRDPAVYRTFVSIPWHSKNRDSQASGISLVAVSTQD